MELTYWAVTTNSVVFFLFALFSAYAQAGEKRSSMHLERLKNRAPERGAFLKDVPVAAETKDVIHFHSKMHENWIMQICFDLGKI